MTSRLPKLVAFDLEYAQHLLAQTGLRQLTIISFTLWDLWIDTHVTRRRPQQT
jgi:hypothetical protein